MPKKPYIVQQDSPNLVIVPTDSTDSCDPSPENGKIVIAPVPPSNVYTVFSKKSAPKLNYNGRNNDVLIDVTKVQRQPTSWATNFLQSIGGSSTKFTRIYSSLPKSPLSLRKITQPQNDAEITLPNTSEIAYGTEINLATSQPTIEEPSRQTKINMNLIKSALHSSMAKETSQTSSTHYYKPKCDTSQGHANKVPSLPKNYKIPMQSKNNKTAINPVMDIEITSPLSINDTCQKSQPSVSTPKSDTDTFHLKHSKNTIPDTKANKLIHPDTNHDSALPKHIQHEKKREKTKISNNTDQLKDVDEQNQPKAKKLKSRHSSENHPSKSKFEWDIPLKSSMEAVQLIKNKENSKLKQNKENKQDKATKVSNKHSKKTKENSDRSKVIKSSNNIENKQQPNFLTKLKTKKEHISSQTTKHSQEKKSKKHKEKVSMNEKNIVSKINKKRSNDKMSEKPENADTKTKKSRKSDGDSNKTKQEISTSINEKRLSKSISPMKSVVSRMKSDFHSTSTEKRYHKEAHHYDFHCDTKSYLDSNHHCHSTEKSIHRCSDIDLRAKLKRKVTKNNESKEHYNHPTVRDHSNKQNTFATVAKGNPFVPEDNLIISFNTEDDTVADEAKEEDATMRKSPVKKMARKQPSGGNKCKKIKLEINIVFGQTDTSDEESMKSDNETNENEETLDNTDLSFLDDFNVDEIVESLNECKDRSRLANKEEHLNIASGEVEDDLSNERIDKIDIMDTEDATALNKNEIKTEILPCDDISAVNNKIENHQDKSLLSAVNVERPCYHEEIQCSINSNATKIKTETEEEIDAETKIPQTETCRDPTARLLCPDVPKTSSDSEKVLPVENNNTISDSNLSVNNTVLLHPKMEKSDADTAGREIEDIKPLITASDDSEKADVRAEDNIKDIKPQIITSQIPEAKSNSANSSSDLIKDNSNVGIKEERFENKTSSTVALHSNTSNKTEIVATPAQNGTDTSTKISKESDVIIINDSESEDETESEQQVKKEHATDDQPIKECPLDDSDDVVIIEDTESILILDTDYNIPSSDGTNSHADITNQNATCEPDNHIPKEQDEDIEENPGKASPEDASNEVKTDTCTEVKSEETKIHNDTQKKSSEVNVSRDVNTKARDNPSSENPAKTDTYITEKCSPKTITAGTESQKPKSPAKIILDNKENNNVTKSNEESEVKVNRCLVDDQFVHKVESKLSFIWEKCTITDVIRNGKFSKVYLCENSRKQEYALKIMKDQYGGFKIGLHKEKMMLKLQNGVPENNLNCVRLIMGFAHSRIWCFLMEYYPSNLQEALAKNKRSYHIDIVQSLSRQLVSAVTILRNNNIVHSDIKPSHILINATQTRIKLCGFDESCYLEYSNLLPNTGTVNYRAPELILGYPAGYGIDVWSTALVMFEMATNQKLFHGVYNNNILYQQLCTLGMVPMDMLNNCAFRNAHFRGTAFSRIIKPGERIIMDKLPPNGKIDRILHRTYAIEWAPGMSQASKRHDKGSIASFSGLLRCMLAMHPKYRIAIEFVFANPFIYESFDDDID